MMAILIDLPNELFYAIGSHVNRAADKLHLFLVNNVALILKVRLLYEHLTVQHHFMMSLRCPVHQLALYPKERYFESGPRGTIIQF